MLKQGSLAIIKRSTVYFKDKTTVYSSGYLETDEIVLILHCIRNRDMLEFCVYAHNCVCYFEISAAYANSYIKRYV